MIQAVVPAQTRDLRIDFARGLANWLMMLDHIPQNFVSLLSVRSFGLSGPVDLFCFASGYGVTLMFGGMMIERGFVIATSRILKRVGQLYAAYLVLFVVYINAIGWMAESYSATDLFSQYHIDGILVDPVGTLIRGVSLRARPLNLDVLRLAILMLASFPLILASLLRWPKTTMVLSVAVYFFAWYSETESLVGLPNDGNYLNPFCWQILFVLGAYLALYGGRLAALMRRHIVLRWAAITYIAISLFAVVGRDHSKFMDVLTGLADRATLGPARILHVLSLAALFSYFVRNNWKGFQSELLSPILICGEEWLACFCIGIFLSLAAHILLVTNQNTIAVQVAASAAAVILQVLAGFYISWSRRQDHISKQTAFGRSG